LTNFTAKAVDLAWGYAPEKSIRKPRKSIWL